MKKIMIMGGGPAGLAAGYELSKAGHQVTIVEKNSQVGGISKTVNKNDYRFDLGGHRFFTKIDEVQQLWEEVLQKDFLVRPRLSRIYYRGKFFDYPLKPMNALFSMGVLESIVIVLSYIQAKVKPIQPEESFEDWVSNRFGKRLYQHFFKSYTEKVWGIPCTDLKAEWAAQRIKGLSLTSAIFNALFGRFKKNTIKTLIEEFNYPRLGPGMMYEAMAEQIASRGGTVLTGTSVSSILVDDNKIQSVEITGPDGSTETLTADVFLSSLALRDLVHMMTPRPADKVVAAAGNMKYRDFLIVSLALEKDYLFPDNWIYVHSPEVKLGRIQNFKQWSPAMVPEEGCSSLGLEYFCNEGDETWNKADDDLISTAIQEIDKIGLIDKAWVKWGTVVRVPKAYPVYDEDYQHSLPVIKEFIGGFTNLQTMGRNGLHRYNNMDHSILTGLLAARNALGENHDLWAVNTDEEYHEEVKK